MSIFTGLISLFIIMYCVLPSTSQSQKVSNCGEDSQAEERNKRALPGLIPLLLKTAKLVKSRKSLKEYNKPGGYAEAVKDFYSLGPKIRVDRQTFKRGLVGDREVTFLFRHQRATLRILGHHLAQDTKIKYID